MHRKSLLQSLIFSVLVLSFILAFPVFSSAQTDITSKIQLLKSALMYDRVAKTSYLDVSLKNISQDVLLTPVMVVIENLSPSGVRVANADGVTSEGKPYFNYSLTSGVLHPNQGSGNKRWIFSNPNALRFSYTARVWGTFNGAPVADAGLDRDVAVGIPVSLDGRNSHDPDGDSLTYKWSITSLPPGSAAILSDPAAAQTTFVVDKPGSYVAQLIVNDGKMDSSPATVTITALSSKPVAPIYPSEVTSFVRPSEAAYLVVQTALGDTVTLEMPRGSFARAQHVTLKVLEALADSPFRTSALLPGIAIEPDGLVLLRGARLQIDLTKPLLHPRATAIAWIRGPNDAVLVANPSSGDGKVEGNLRHFSTYQPVDLAQAAAAGELTLVVPPTSQEYGELVDAAIDAQSKAKLARAFCAGLAGCTLGDPAAHDAQAINLLGAGIDALLGDTNPADACGSYLANLYETLNAVANLVGADDLAAALRDKIRVLEAQCCAPNTCSPVCPDCPDRGHWTIQWYKSGMASVLQTSDPPGYGQRTDCLHSWSETGNGFAEIQFGTGYVSAFSMNWKKSDEQKVTLTFHGCASGVATSWTKGSCALNANGISQAESYFSDLFRITQPRVSYILNPLLQPVEASCDGEVHFECDYVNNCDVVPRSCSQNETNPSSSTGGFGLGLGGGYMFPVDSQGLIYSLTATVDRLTGCALVDPWGYYPITFDIEAAWTDASSQGPPPPPCRGVTCQPRDECHDPGSCIPATGTCPPVKVLVGASCGGDYCTAAGTCDAQGTCVPGAPIPRCPEPDDDVQCPGVQCDPATGACIYAADGNTCSDGNLCTDNDQCSRGKCRGTPKSCPKVKCMSAQCNEWSGECDIPLGKGEKCSRTSVCEECDGNGTCVPLTQTTVNMGCQQLITETLKLCKENPWSGSWRVDVMASTGGGTEINQVACLLTNGELVDANSPSAWGCLLSGGALCQGGVTHISVASDTQCARARDTIQGVCEATCSICRP